MSNFRKDYEKNMTSLEVLNIIVFYFMISMMTGVVLLFNWMSGRGPYTTSILSDTAYWWVLGAFILSTLATFIGRYCADKSIDAD